MKSATTALGAIASAILTAAMTVPASAHDVAPGGPKLEETVVTAFERALPNVPGKQFIALEVTYPPGAASPAHRHPDSAFIFAYVLSGEVLSAVDGEEPRVYRAGESWQETPGAHHRVSRNASKTEPARLLAIFVKDIDAAQLVVPDAD